MVRSLFALVASLSASLVSATAMAQSSPSSGQTMQFNGEEISLDVGVTIVGFSNGGSEGWQKVSSGMDMSGTVHQVSPTNVWHPLCTESDTRAGHRWRRHQSDLLTKHHSGRSGRLRDVYLYATKSYTHAVGFQHTLRQDGNGHGLWLQAEPKQYLEPTASLRDASECCHSAV